MDVEYSVNRPNAMNESVAKAIMDHKNQKIRTQIDELK